MSMPILYHAPFSTCSQKVRYALGYKKIAYESRMVDMTKSEHLGDAYLALNPNGVVPTLVDHERAVVDSAVICEYLDEAYPQVPLSPTGALDRAAMRSWMRYFEEVPTPAIRAPSFNALFARSITARGEEANKVLRERMPLRSQFYAKMGPEGFAPDIIQESLDRLASCLARVAKALADGRPFVMGDALTIADISLLPSLVRMIDINLASMWDDLPGIAGWLARMEANPAFAIAYPPGSRPTPDGVNL